MGSCSCTNKKIIEVFIEPDLKKPPSIPRNILESCVRHHNVLVWSTDEKTFKDYFPNAYYVYQNAPDAVVTFSFIKYTPEALRTGLVIDCLLFVMSQEVEFTDIKKILDDYSEIYIKIIISPVNQAKIEELGIKIVEDTNKFYQELFSQQSSIEKNLKGIFESLDKDLDGNIDSDEMEAGLKKLDIMISKEQAVEYIKSIDLNNDGKINFYEFSYWWRRGRHGGDPFIKIKENWTEAIHSLLPIMTPFYSLTKINRKKNKKKIKINIGNECESKLRLNVTIGRSAKREEILREINNLLGLNIYECWVAFQIKHKNESTAKSSLLKIEDMILSIKSSLLAGTIIGKEVIDSISHKVALSGLNIYFAVYFDVCNDHIDESLSFLSSIDKLFKSPVDDYFDLEMACEGNIHEMTQKSDKNFFESIENGRIIINSETWEDFGDFMDDSGHFNKLLKNFFKLEGERILENPKSECFKSFISYLNFFSSPLKKVFSVNQQAEDFINSFGKDFATEVDLYIRYNNFGLHFGLSCDDISNIFKANTL
jgi:EF-hand domain pair